jgi:hypothetical protein
MTKKRNFPSWKYSSGIAADALVAMSVLLILYTISYRAYLGFNGYVLSMSTYRALLLSFSILMVLFITAAVWFFSARTFSRFKTGFLGSVVRYDHWDRKTKEVYSNYRIHLDNFLGLRKLRRIAGGVRELKFALEFLITLRSIKQELPKDWPRPKKIKATSFKLKKGLKLVQSLGLPVVEIPLGVNKISAAFLSAFVERPSFMGFIKFIENLKSPLYTFSISFDDLQNMDLDREIARFERAIARRERR